MIAGVNALKTAEAVTGYRPNLIIAPEYSATESIGLAMGAVAQKLWATAIVDVDAENESAALAVAANYGSRFVLLVHPDTVTLDGIDMPSSAGWAGLIAYMDASSTFGWTESATVLCKVSVQRTALLIMQKDKIVPLERW